MLRLLFGCFISDVKPSLYLIKYHSAFKYNSSYKEDDTQDHTDYPCQFHSFSKEVKENVGDDTHKKVCKKVGHGISLFIYHRKHKVGDDVSDKNDRYDPVHGKMQKS